ncbi:thiol-disulfide oxidoreductase ResA [Paenibacillus sp. y28]|uniref:thiol-disulfide oxidoreductase ResA n=1 Tax=Paenibacillus sp. y28 TaxID=3129110 RepID=UPI0030195CE8
MGKNRRWIQIAILLVVVVIGGYTITQSLWAENDKPREGGKAPAFSLQGTDGQIHELSDYKGKALLINFWGTWCEPCVREMPAIERQYGKWKDKGFEVVGINLNESSVNVQNFVKQNGLSFPILYDPGYAIRNKYAVTSYPTSFFVTPEGKIMKIAVGEMQESFIEDTLTKLIGK